MGMQEVAEYLKKNPWAKQSDIWKDIGLGQQSVSRTLNTLEKRGEVIRKETYEDFRHQYRWNLNE